MPANRERKYRQVIDYIEDQVGADINRDLIKMGLEDVSVGQAFEELPTDLQQIDGIDQTGADLMQILASLAGDEVRARTLGLDDSGALQEAQVEALNVAPAAGTLAQVTYLARALNSQDLDQFITRVTDSSGAQLDPLNQDALQAVANDELRARLHDSAGVQIDPLNQDALQAVANDELRARVHDSTGTQVDPLTQAVFQSVANDELRARLFADDDAGNTAQLQAEELGTALGGTETALITYVSQALAAVGNDQLRVDLQNNNAGTLPVEQQTPVALEDDGGTVISTSNPLSVDAPNTLPVEQQTPVGIEDTTGTQVNPDEAPDYPDSATTGHDLIGTGDLVLGPVSVARAEAAMLSITSTDGNTFSVSVDWVDGAGNTFQSETATDIGLDNVTEDWARLVRKGPEAEVTITDTSGATSNNINVFLDVHR